MRSLFVVSVALLVAVDASAGGPLRWVRKPELTFDTTAGTWYATFDLDALTDVEAALVDPATSRVVRHLAAGVLGPKAPAPLAAGSRAQKLGWDGKDDDGNKVARPNSLALRVRAVMSVALEQIVGGDPYAYFSEEMGHIDQSPFGINGLEAKPDGTVYVLGHSSNLGPPALRQYDRDGTYHYSACLDVASRPPLLVRAGGVGVAPLVVADHHPDLFGLRRPAPPARQRLAADVQRPAHLLPRHVRVGWSGSAT